MVKTPEGTPAFSANMNLEGAGEFLSPRYYRLVLDRDYAHQHSDRFQTTSKALDTGKAVRLASSKSDSEDRAIVIPPGGGLALISLYPNSTTVTVYASAETEEQAKAIVDWVRELNPEIADDDEEPDEVYVRFWTVGGMGGPQQVTRRIAVPAMADILPNYNEDTAKELNRLVGPDFKPGAGGQLLLWYGPPGAGKTYALRALARDWRKWCSVDYVVDPEQFFGNSNYLMPVLLSGDRGHKTRLRFTPDGDAIPATVEPEEQWRLLIFEDTGELLSANAKERAGQGLSRLLNVVDGFIGQGLRTLLLITTNEELSSLHPAVSRPGRCAVKTHFTHLEPARAQAWADANGLPKLDDRKHSLAELFAMRDDNRREAPKRSKGRIGFSAERTAA